MFKSYLKSALRHLFNNRQLSAINIFGLSISIAICVLTYIFISFEFSHDNFHKKGDRIYQVVNKTNWKSNKNTYNFLQKYKLAEDLKRDNPEIINSTGLKTCEAWIKYNNKKLYENIAFTDSSFFNIFTFDFIIGSEKTALKDENDIFITKELADKLITANSNLDYSKLIGKDIEFPNIRNRSLTIAGILNNIPKNSTLKFDIVTNYSHSRYYSQSNNDFGNTSIYVELNNATNKENVEKTTSTNIKKYYGDLINHFIQGESIESEKDLSIELVNFSDTYFSEKIAWESYSLKGDIKRSYVLASISILVLLLACINYIMLSVGISMKRFKEIAIRKVFGSKRVKVIIQFVIETYVTVLVSLLLGIVIAELALPLFNDLTGYKLEFNLYTNIIIYTFLLLLSFIIVAIISIPGIYISKLNPIIIFRNQSKLGTRLGLAKSFMVIQFALSLILIISSIFILKQISFMKGKDVGFNTNNIVSIDMPSDFNSSTVESFQNRLSTINGIASVGGSDRNFVWGSSSSEVVIDTNKMSTRLLRIDSSYFNTLGIKIIEGRNIRETDNVNDLNAVVINETFAKKAGLENPVGKFIELWRRNVQIVGIAEDFHFDSMVYEIQPVCCFNGKVMNRINALFVKIKAGNVPQTISEMKEIWREFESERELKYSFLDENLKKQYVNEERTAKIINTITIIALFISIFGLIGLTTLLIMQKIKEIGIRKINGATTSNILVMINKEFAKYLIIATIIAIPISYYGLSTWLDNFAYKINLEWWIFVINILSLSLIVFITISYKTYRAASSNPINAIKYE